MFQIKLREHPALESGCGVSGAVEGILGENLGTNDDNDCYYCSEYIAEILPIFETVPMKFGDDEQEISKFWQDYYDKLGLAVPLNQPGTNPSQLANSAFLQYLGELHD